MRHPQTKKIVIRTAAYGVAFGCILATAAPAADSDIQQTLKASTPNNPNVVRLPKCKKKGMRVVVDLSTGTTNGVSNPNGTLDPKWQLNSAPPGTGFTTPVPVYSIPPCCGAWAPPVAPATWVSPWQNGSFPSTAVSGIYRYEVTFSLPAGYTSIQVQGVCRADDEGRIALDGTPMSMPYCHFPASAQIGTFNFNVTSPPQGLHYLRARVQNGPGGTHTTGDPTGLMVQATLTAQCR